jgi:UDP-galactopyranose mutase
MIDACYVVVGCGIFGSVVAERLAVAGKPVLVIDKRKMIGGNSASHMDRATGIECHTYGSHIFHTSNEEVFRYMLRFTKFTNYRHHVAIRTGGHIYFMPINLNTLCEFFDRDFTPSEAAEFLTNEIAQANITKPSNLEEKAISLIGEKIYRAFIYGYTKKQWGKPPVELPESIITRLPVRLTFNTDYFNDPYQGIPLDGYNTMFHRMLTHENITLMLGTDYFKLKPELPESAVVIYTGMIDEFFDYCFGPLSWRSLKFEYETLNLKDYQGISVMNYGDESTPFTRIHEFKHYHPERSVFSSGKTIICREYPDAYAPGKEAYYPINDTRNMQILTKYQELAKTFPNVVFGGRLGCYQYWDMDKAVKAALDCASSILKCQTGVIK